MNLTQQLWLANEQAIIAHKKAAAIAHELLTALVELNKVHDAYVLRMQIDYHEGVVKTLQAGEFGA